MIRLLLGLVSCSLSFAEKYEPIFKDSAETTAFIQRVIQENPWVTPLGIGAHLNNGLNQSQRFLPGLLAHTTYKNFDAYQRPMMVLHIEQKYQTQEKVSVLSPEAFLKIKADVSHIFQNLEAGEESLSQKLNQKILQNLKTLSQGDPRAILTGLIHCLPKEERAAFFKASSTEELFKALSAKADLTDEVLKAQFKAELYQITPEQVSREFVFNRVSEFIELEQETISLLRAHWFLKDFSNDETSIQEKIHEASSEAFDLTEVDTDKIKEFFEPFLEASNFASKDTLKRARNYLERVSKLWLEAEHTFEERTVIKGRPHLTLREVPAYIAVHRSQLSGDCGTRDDFPFPYSPLERTFFLFDAGGNAIGYIGTTLIHTNNELTLYVHDATGPMSMYYKELALEAIFLSLKYFGVKKMTLATTGTVITRHTRDTIVNNQYLDTEIRNYFVAYSHNPHGDRPQDNYQSTPFVSMPALLNDYQVRVEENGLIADENKKPTSKRDIFSQLLDLTAGKENVEDFLGFLGIEKTEIQRILSILQNKDRLTLENYYRALTKLFEQYEIPISEKFLKKHEEAFMHGHLNSAGIFTSTHEDLNEKTISFTLSILRRGKNKEFAYELIRQNPGFFCRSPKFAAYVSEIPITNREFLDRIKKLIEVGIPSQTIAPTVERLVALSQTDDIFLPVWAVQEWRRRGGGELDEQKLNVLARALKNENHPNDDISLIAIRILSRVKTQNAPLLESLKKSVSREENPEIARLAAMSLLRNGVPREEIERLVQKNKHNEALQKIMQVFAQRYDRKNPCIGEVINAGLPAREERKAVP